MSAVAGNARGIDVSNFGGEFNWAGTSGLSFGICRASQGLGAAGTNSPDPFLTWNWPRIKTKGLARGAYHFLDPRLDRLTLTPFLIVTARNVVLQVAGEQKAAVLARALKGPEDLVACPAQWLRRAAGRVVIVGDAAAVSAL